MNTPALSTPDFPRRFATYGEAGSIGRGPADPCPAGDMMSSALTKFRPSIVTTVPDGLNEGLARRADGLRTRLGGQEHQAKSDHV